MQTIAPLRDQQLVDENDRLHAANSKLADVLIDKQNRIARLEAAVQDARGVVSRQQQRIAELERELAARSGHLENGGPQG